MHSEPELVRIFSPVRQAVIGIDCTEYKIIFVNAAAKSAFGFDPTGNHIKDIIASDILSGDATEYMCGTTILGRKASVSVVKDSNLTLLYIDFLSSEKNALNITRHMISSLQNSAMGLKMSADHCFSVLEEGKLPREKFISVFYHYYYSLLQTLISIDNADQIGRGDLVFSSVSTDLVKLCAELTDTVAVLCSKTGVKISFTTNEQELIAVVDPKRIEQMLLNLFANSLKHTSSGNSITLSLARAGNKIIISLDDDGEGIPQEVMSNIFEIPEGNGDAVFQQSGSDLGLYIAFGIAQLHKGVLLVESREGKGTCVRFMLPVDAEPATKFNCPETPYHHSGVSNILIWLADVLPSSSYGLKYED